MPSPGLLRHVALVRTNFSVDSSASIIRVTRIGELGTTLGVTSNRRTLRRNTSRFLRSMHQLLVTANVVPSSPIVSLMMEALGSSETSVLTRSTRRNNPEDDILHNYAHFCLNTPQTWRDYCLQYSTDKRLLNFFVCNEF
jgi:hypothetical protein